jgi:hypothetical protein
MFDQAAVLAVDEAQKWHLEILATIHGWLTNWNDKPQPFVWKATGDVILDRCAVVKNLLGRHTR